VLYLYKMSFGALFSPRRPFMCVRISFLCNCISLFKGPPVARESIFVLGEYLIRSLLISIVRSSKTTSQNTLITDPCGAFNVFLYLSKRSPIFITSPRPFRIY
jgi:hypothetical protein